MLGFKVDRKHLLDIMMVLSGYYSRKYILTGSATQNSCSPMESG
jgi:hypothetical protein